MGRSFPRSLGRAFHAHLVALSTLTWSHKPIGVPIGTCSYQSTPVKNAHAARARGKGHHTRPPRSDPSPAPHLRDTRAVTLRLGNTPELQIGRIPERLSYVITADGLLTAMHDTVPSAGGRHRVAIFNPGSNTNRVSRLRLVNPGEEAAEVSIVGVDDGGESPGSEVPTTIPAGASRTFTAAELESGGEGLEGALGDGEGKWRLTVESAQPIATMSLLSDSEE